MKIVAVIQARMGSNRFPGKVMANIEGKPMLHHIINRLGFCKNLDGILVATTIEQKDDLIEESLKGNKIEVYRGSEENVLDRYYQAAKKYKIENHVVLW